jgi:hypothetical protein
VAEIQFFFGFTLIHMRNHFHLTNYRNCVQTLVMQDSFPLPLFDRLVILP